MYVARIKGTVKHVNAKHTIMVVLFDA